VTRYNLRKFTELPFQLVRCYRQVKYHDDLPSDQNLQR
jgi:hypothetical protein